MHLHLGDNGEGYVRSGLDLLDKQTKSAVKALDALGLPTMQVDVLISHHGRLLKSLGDRKALEPLALEPIVVPTLRLALSMEIAKLEATMTQQVTLGILQPGDTEQALARTRALREEIADQATLAVAEA